MTRLWRLGLWAIFCLGSAPYAHSQEVAQEEAVPKVDENSDEFRHIAEQLRCPTCQNLSVLGSDAPFSKQIRDIVGEQMQAGKSEKEIIAFFTERYGPWILREPPKEGVSL